MLAVGQVDLELAGRVLGRWDRVVQLARAIRALDARHVHPFDLLLLVRVWQSDWVWWAGAGRQVPDVDASRPTGFGVDGGKAHHAREDGFGVSGAEVC